VNNTVRQSKERVTWALGRFETALRFVPADKLDWSPTPTAKSAFQIAAHCAGYSGVFPKMIRAVGFPWTLDEFQAEVRAAIEAVSTLDDAEAALRQGVADTLAALDGVTDEQVESVVDTPGLGPTPFTFFMTVAALHLEGHAAQIDYLQTCWDDQDVHL